MKQVASGIQKWEDENENSCITIFYLLFKSNQYWKIYCAFLLNRELKLKVLLVALNNGSGSTLLPFCAFLCPNLPSRKKQLNYTLFNPCFIPLYVDVFGHIHC